jgi:hypothetical protein
MCVCVCVYIIYIPQGGWCGRPGIWMIHIVEEIKLLLLYNLLYIYIHIYIYIYKLVDICCWCNRGLG